MTMEEEIEAALLKCSRDENENLSYWAYVAAEIARKYVKEAFHMNPALSVNQLPGMTTEEDIWKEWSKKKGI